MNNEIKLLDYGYIKLLDTMGSDLKISQMARQSYDSEWRAGVDNESDEKLINYLLKNKHTTPFEHCCVTFGIKAPIFVFRQWHRHRTQSYSEVSARYVELPNEFYVPELDQITTQSKDNKQMRTEDQNNNANGIALEIDHSNRKSFLSYEALLEEGCPRELARSVLPVGTYSKMSTTANLLNWFRFMELRLHPHAQYEIRVYADAMLELLEPVYPVAVAAFKQHWRISS